MSTATAQTRIKSQVETRAGTCERGVALWRVLVFNAEQDEDLKPRVSVARERTVERLQVMYRPELAIALGARPQIHADRPGGHHRHGELGANA